MKSACQRSAYSTMLVGGKTSGTAVVTSIPARARRSAADLTTRLAARDSASPGEARLRTSNGARKRATTLRTQITEFFGNGRTATSLRTICDEGEESIATSIFIASLLSSSRAPEEHL